MRALIAGLIIAVIIVICDQWSKIYIFNLLDETPYQIIELLPFLNFVKVYNSGVSFGMFNQISHGRIILSTLAIAITIGMCVWLYRVKTKLLIYSLGLVIGGAIGNIIDRVRVGAVYDFIDFHMGGHHWPAFNIADTSIFIGVALLILDSIINKENNKTHTKDESDDVEKL